MFHILTGLIDTDLFIIVIMLGSCGHRRVHRTLNLQYFHRTPGHFLLYSDSVVVTLAFTIADTGNSHKTISSKRLCFPLSMNMASMMIFDAVSLIVPLPFMYLTEVRQFYDIWELQVFLCLIICGHLCNTY